MSAKEKVKAIQELTTALRTSSEQGQDLTQFANEHWVTFSSLAIRARDQGLDDDEILWAVFYVQEEMTIREAV